MIFCCSLFLFFFSLTNFVTYTKDFFCETRSQYICIRIQKSLSVNLFKFVHNNLLLAIAFNKSIIRLVACNKSFFVIIIILTIEPDKMLFCCKLLHSFCWGFQYRIFRVKVLWVKWLKIIRVLINSGNYVYWL